MTDSESIKTENESIKLDQFLKIKGVVDTGGQAKLLIQDGEVKVNGKVETRRGRKLIQGDRVSTFGETFQVDLSNLLDGWD
ncbi:MAG: RNA-binding protein [Leptolyngbya sp.]|nr:MAG: RNA-binding protein [Leptolyngbya sp.]